MNTIPNVGNNPTTDTTLERQWALERAYLLNEIHYLTRKVLRLSAELNNRTQDTREL